MGGGAPPLQLFEFGTVVKFLDHLEEKVLKGTLLNHSVKEEDTMEDGVREEMMTPVSAEKKKVVPSPPPKSVVPTAEAPLDVVLVDRVEETWNLV